MNTADIINKWEPQLAAIRSSVSDHMKNNTWDMAAMRVDQGRLINEFLGDVYALREQEKRDRGPG